MDTIELCEKKGYGIDTYMFPLNMSGFVYPGYNGSESVRDRVDIVRGVAKPFILIKALGAGRIQYGEYVKGALSGVKIPSERILNLQIP